MMDKGRGVNSVYFMSNMSKEEVKECPKDCLNTKRRTLIKQDGPTLQPLLESSRNDLVPCCA